MVEIKFLIVRMIFCFMRHVFFSSGILWARELYIKDKPRKLSDHRKTTFLKLKADFLHHKKDFDGAFKAFWQMNESAKKASSSRQASPINITIFKK